MFSQIKLAIRQFILKTLLNGVVQEIQETGLTDDDRQFLLAELSE